MTESAALLADDVFPKQLVRRRMLSVPFLLCFQFASSPGLMQSVFNEELGHHLVIVLGGADAIGDEGVIFA